MQKRTNNFGVWIAAIGIAVFSLVGAISYVTAATGINRQISFQGRVINVNGTNVSAGTYSFTFSLYSQSTGGTALWTETKTLTVTDSVFGTYLGSTTPFPVDFDFNDDSLYLGINFNSDGEMEPRIRLSAVAQTFTGDKVNGLTVTSTTGTLTVPNSATIAFGGDFTTQGTSTLTLITTAATNVTLPTSGTLATLAGVETLSNKTLGVTSINGDVTPVGSVNLGTVGSRFNSLYVATLDATNLSVSTTSSLGTVSGGVWQGTTIGAQYGGTNLNTSASTGIPVIAGGTWAVLANGSNTECLVIMSGVPTWSSCSSGGGVTGSGVIGQLSFWDTANTIANTAGLEWDAADSELGIGTASPIAPLTVRKASTGIALAVRDTTDTTNVLTISTEGDINGRSLTVTNDVQVGGSATVTSNLEVNNDATVDGQLTVGNNFIITAGGASIIGGIDNNSGGITEVGAISGTGTILPDADNTRDLGASGNRFANVYAANLQGSITPTSFTQGSVVYAGSGGTLSQDNSVLYYDGTNDTLGVGITRSGAISSTNARVVVKGAGTSSATASLAVQDSSNARLFVVQDDGRVSIGDAGMGASLDVKGPTDRNVLRVSGGANPYFIINGNGNTVFNRNISITPNLSQTSDTLFTVNSQASQTGNLVNVTSSGGSSGDIFNILASGSIGIGTTTVGSKLQVNGGVAIGFSASTAAPSNGLRVAGATIFDTTATISSGGLSVTDGIDNNNGGITETGAISGATTGSFSSTVGIAGLLSATSAGTGLAVTNNATVGGTLAVTGIVTGGTYNGQTISSSASFSGTLATANTLTVSSGGASITGNVTVTGNILPNADNTRDLGASGTRWANVYAANFVGSITPTGFTQGSVVFAGTGGTLTQDNTNLFFDNVTKGLKVNGLGVRSLTNARAVAGGLYFGGSTGARVHHQITSGSVGTSDITLSNRFEVPSAVANTPGIMALTSSANSYGVAGAFRVYLNTSDQLTVRITGVTTGDTRDKRINNFTATYAGQIVDLHVIRTAGDVQIYINGVLQTPSEASGGSVAWSDSISGTYFSLGSTNATTGVLGSKMYAARFYNRAFSQNDVYREIQEGPALSDRYGNLTGPVAGLVIDSGLARANPAMSTTVADLSSNSFSGTAAGSTLPVQVDVRKNIYASGISIFGGAMTISSGGLTVTAGGINNTAGGITNAGAITGATTLTASGATTLSSTSGVATAIGNATGTFQLTSNALNITTAGAVSGATTITSSGTNSTTATSAAFTANSATTTAFQATAAPSTVAGASLVQLGAAINSTGAPVGNYIGINAATLFAGDFLHLELNGVNRFVVTSKGEVQVTNGTTDAIGLQITQAASAAGDLVQLNNNSNVALFVVDATGKVASGESLPGVPIVGVDPSSGTAGDLTSTASALKPYADTGLTLNIAPGSAYTANLVSSQTKLARCNLSTLYPLSLTDNSTEYVYVTASGAASTAGITCQINKSATLPDFSPSKPVVVLAKTVTAGGVITSVADTRFFIGGVMNYVAMPASSTYEPGMIVKIDTGVDNGIITSTSAADTGVYGIVAIGATTAGSPGKVIVLTGGNAWGQATSTTVRASCAGTTTAAGILADVVGAVNGCVGRIMTAATASTPSVLVHVAPN